MNPPEPGLQPLRLLLTVWTGEAGRWLAHAELPDGSVRTFESPFELARFVGCTPVQPPPASAAGLR